MNKVLFLLLVAILGFSACRSVKIRKKTADELVIGLHEGVLLVRLQTAQGKAEALRQIEKPEKAEEVLTSQHVFNQQVRLAFEKHYHFSPVFFFYAPDSRQIRERNFLNILHDFKEQPASKQSIANQPFLVAEFSEVQAPATNAGLDALLLLDEQLKQLAIPFPYAVPTHLYAQEDIPDIAVAKLNLKLQDFYARAAYREQKRALRNLRRGIMK